MANQQNNGYSDRNGNGSKAYGSGPYGERSYGSGYRGDMRNDEDQFPEHEGDEDIAVDETSRLIASNKVEGTAVYGRDGDRLGSIHNFMVDKQSGRVEYAVLTFGGFMGMGGTYYPIPWNMLHYDTQHGGYMVDMDEHDLDHAPSWRSGQEPDLDDERYGRMVSGYYGM